MSERGLLEARESGIGLLSTRRVLLGGLALLAFSPTGLIGPHGACAAARLKSRASDVPCVLRLVNASGEWVKLYWLNYDGACPGVVTRLHERVTRAVAVATSGQPRNCHSILIPNFNCAVLPCRRPGVLCKDTAGRAVHCGDL